MSRLRREEQGTWKAETATDTTVLLEFIPSEKGYLVNVYYQAKGETYVTGKGIVGFAKNKKLVNMYLLWPNGMVSRDFGKFVSENNITWERYNADHNHVVGIIEGTFKSSDKFIHNWKSRGMQETWDDANVTEAIFNRVEK